MRDGGGEGVRGGRRAPQVKARGTGAAGRCVKTLQHLAWAQGQARVGPKRRAAGQAEVPAAGAQAALPLESWARAPLGPRYSFARPVLSARILSAPVAPASHPPARPVAH